MKDDVISKNYARLIDIETDENKTGKLNFTLEQIKLLTLNDNLPEAKITSIFLYTGMRANELLKLKKSAVDLNNMTITGGSKTSAGKNRVILIHQNIAGYLLYFLNANPECEYLLSKNGKPVSYEFFTRSMFYPMLNNLGIQRQDEDGNNILTLHRTRHTWVQMAIEGGMTPEALQKIAGHAKYETSVNKYADIINIAYLKQEMNKV